MAVFSIVIATAGVLLVLLGLGDAFLTILHPDRDGRYSSALNRGIWRGSVLLARIIPRKRREILGMAGPGMVVGNILLWMLAPITGFALLFWPFLAGGFDTPPSLGTDLWDAFYFSGVTFTTLGFGDITPVTRIWEILSIAEAITGFLVMSTSIAYIVAVFEGVDHRDALALQIYSETGGTWNGGEFVHRVLEDEDVESLRERLEVWANLIRELHGRLYRFHGLALYLRTHGLDRGPERMLYGLADVALRGKVLASAPRLRRLRPSADHLAFGLDHFATAMVRRHGTRASRAAIERVEPTEDDRRVVREAWAMAAARFGPEWPAIDEDNERELFLLTARLRIFLRELDRLTLWRTMPGEDETSAFAP